MVSCAKVGFEDCLKVCKQFKEEHPELGFRQVKIQPVIGVITKLGIGKVQELEEQRGQCKWILMDLNTRIQMLRLWDC